MDRACNDIRRVRPDVNIVIVLSSCQSDDVIDNGKRTVDVSIGICLIYE